MSSPLTYPVVVDDKDLDDAALWAMIDSASASHSSSKIKALATAKFPTRQPPSPISYPCPPPSKFRKLLRDSGDSGEVVQDPWPYRPPRKAPRLCASEESSPLALIRSVQRTPPPKEFSSPDAQELSCYTEVSPRRFFVRNEAEEKENGVGNSLLGMFPSVSLFKEYQNTAMGILEKTDYTLISGNPFIKKSGWRKISCYFNISYEIRDKNIEFDENRNVQRAEFVIRALMQGGRFSDGWGSCDRREKRFQKPNHDVPSTAETRAKNKACQDLLGIGEYRPGATSQFH
ncbi:hypothetical protein PHAVU_008G100000 [Phaseolus vulgaris]|uniref:Uncharacterized protein n=1 Tax=Phaseolus vulgaris TaxID=3885 RepID=V7B321_PHAVU|nr:hypothetical protein PHAVU_008G100000g [Phaseolus vulgaris]ESW12287.1 hypothetical protein PHAVU_008G100000g [Phaseolus vulgaris]